MRITVRGPAAVTSSKTGKPLSSPRKLRKLNKLVSDDSCANYFDESLSDLDLQDGRLRMSFDAKTGSCEIHTIYESPSELTSDQLEELKDATLGQWSDGIGEGCFDEFQTEHEMEFDLCPSSADVTVEQKAASSKSTPKRRMIFGAIKKGDLEKVRKAIESGEDLESRKERVTPLLMAAHEGQVEIVRLLLESGADVNATTNDDNQGVLLTIAVIRNEFIDDDLATELAEILLAHGANPNAVDNYGHTPMALARNRGKQRLEETLRVGGGVCADIEFEVQNSDGAGVAVEIIFRHELAQGASSFRSSKSGKLVAEELTIGTYHLIPIDDLEIEPASITVDTQGRASTATLVARPT